jgi:IS30 family transposase
MPRVRRLGHMPQLSDSERGRIVGLRKAGLSVREIARRTGRFVRTILRYHKAWTQEGRKHRARGTGRRRMTTENQDQSRSVYLSLSHIIYLKPLFSFEYGIISTNLLEIDHLMI